MITRRGQIFIFWATILTIATSAIVSVQFLFSTDVALKGIYVLSGTIVGISMYRVGGQSNILQYGKRRSGVKIRKLTGVVLLSAFSAWIYTGDMTVPAPLFALAIGLIVYSFRVSVSPKWILISVILLFSIITAGRFLTTGFYYVYSDLLYHAGKINKLFNTGTTIGLGSYGNYPVYHVIGANLRLLSGVKSKLAMTFVGHVSFITIILCTYVVARQITNSRVVGIGVILGILSTSLFWFYSAFFFPQALAVTAVFVLLVITHRTRHYKLRFYVLGTVVGTGVAFTHHLTQVLFVAPLALYLFLERLPLRKRRDALCDPVLLGIVFSVSLLNWIFSGTAFIRRLVLAAVMLLTAGAFGGRDAVEIYELGTPPKVQSTLQSFGPAGIRLVYLTLLFGTVILAITKFIEDDKVRNLSVSATFVGLLGAALIFPTPLYIKSRLRIAFPWMFFFAFVLGIGLIYIVRDTNRGDDKNNIGLSRYVPIAAALLLICAPISTTQTSQFFWRGLGDSDQITDRMAYYSESESAQLEQISNSFLRSSPSVTSIGVLPYRLEAAGYSFGSTISVQNETLSTESKNFLYRHRWSGKRVRIPKPGTFSRKAIIGDDWLSSSVARNAKVYDSGKFGVLWDRNRVVLKEDN
ncbi:hypothetical protein [Halosimplex halobium]|uniref:hypothetical protein n=1 Tax=Halosimplex halobium TaxID=3396618 RepID=UPI003F55A170